MPEILHIEKRSTDMEVHSAPPQQPSLMMVIANMASNPNMDPDKLLKFMELQERWEMNKAKAEFRDAMAQFKANPPEIVKKRTAGQGNFTYKYADLENVTSAIVDGLAAVGITHSWKHSQGQGGISVSCTLSKGIYSEEGNSLTAEPDVSGGKNKIQSVGSTLSYLERYTLLAACGLAAGLPDTDGNSPDAGMPDEVKKNHLKAINEAKNEAELKAAFTAAWKAAQEIKDSNAGNAFAEAKNKRLKEVKNANTK